MSSDILIALLTLTSLEIVLGIDNIIFIAIVAGRLPEAEQNKARVVGLALALVTRLMLLLALQTIMSLQSPLFTVLDHAFSGRDLLLLGGGLFLFAKATLELHKKVEAEHETGSEVNGRPVSFWGIITQILLIDIIFSLDSVITAVGMVNNLAIMTTAIVLSLVVMLLFSRSIVSIINKHPTLKVLALSFLVLVGFVLMLDGLGKHIDKGYVYFAMAFSVGVELINLRMRRSARH